MANKDQMVDFVSPVAVLNEIAMAVPADCHDKIVIIGSLAVGYHYFQNQQDMAVRTKDADCLLFPREAAAKAGREITEKLIRAKWQFRSADLKWGKPGNSSTPDDELPAVRLHPPGKVEWFIELLAAPELSVSPEHHWVRIETEYGHFGLPSFGFLSLANYKPISTKPGVLVALPEMMALANLLEHPAIEPTVMSGGFAGRIDIKRSNKDLGRVLAIARLAMGQDDDALLTWPDLWSAALLAYFPKEYRFLITQAGKGLRALLGSEPDLEQALYTCANGLLAAKPPTLKQLYIAGERLLADVVIPLETEAAKG